MLKARAFSAYYKTYIYFPVLYIKPAYICMYTCTCRSGSLPAAHGAKANVFFLSKGSIYRRGARRWRKLYRVNGHIFQAKRFNRVRNFLVFIAFISPISPTSLPFFIRPQESLNIRMYLYAVCSAFISSLPRFRLSQRRSVYINKTEGEKR